MAARKDLSRRSFVKAGMQERGAGFPSIVPATVFGQNAPSNRINIGTIGTGRISRGHDLPGTWKYDSAQIVAVCDLDSKRVELGKEYVNNFYAKKTGKAFTGTKGYASYHELLANKDVDAVIISTPDHQHAIVAVDAVRAGKDVYLQKPASLTIAEGRYLSNAVQSDRPHSSDRFSTAFVEAVPSRLRTREKRAHRRSEACRDRASGRSLGTGCS